MQNALGKNEYKILYGVLILVAAAYLIGGESARPFFIPLCVFSTHLAIFVEKKFL